MICYVRRIWDAAVHGATGVEVRAADLDGRLMSRGGGIGGIQKTHISSEHGLNEHGRRDMDSPSNGGTMGDADSVVSVLFLRSGRVRQTPDKSRRREEKYSPNNVSWSFFVSAVVSKMSVADPMLITIQDRTVTQGGSWGPQ
jgi:hypothetical protein